MNHTSLLHPFQLDYPDSEYLGQERVFPNIASLSSNNGFLQPLRKTASTNQISAQPGPLPINPSVKYSSHPGVHDSPFHSTSTSSLLLSPPDSLSGSISASGNSTSSFACSTLPKLCPSNASATDPYSNVSASFLHLGWNDPSMSEYPRPRVPALHSASLSPPLLTYGPAGGMPGPFSGPPRVPADPYGTSFQTNRMGLSHAPTHFNDLNKYSTLSSSSRISDQFNTFTSPSSSFHQATAMSLDVPTRTSPSRQEGPPFEETKVIHPVLTARSHQLMPEILASIQKGFFQVDHKWTCYRRNYFTVSCSFNLKNQAIDGHFYLQHHSGTEPITRFAVSISAKTAVMNNQESETRALVQHTPKRDKATESVPQRQVIQPIPPNLLSSSSGPMVNNNLYPGSHHVSTNSMGGFDAFGSNQHQPPPTSYTFERIQFQKATANNGKRRAQQQYFHIVVELLAEVGRGGGSANWVLIATRQSHPMVVRGRSPGHYKDNVRRDSAASMDPDRGGGAGGDGGGGPLSMPSLLNGPPHSSSMDWASTHRNGSYFGGSNYRHVSGPGYSPTSIPSSTGFSNSLNELDSEFQDDSGASPSSAQSIELLSESPQYQQRRNIGTDLTSQRCSSSRNRLYEGARFFPETSPAPRHLLADGLRS